MSTGGGTLVGVGSDDSEGKGKGVDTSASWVRPGKSCGLAAASAGTVEWARGREKEGGQAWRTLIDHCRLLLPRSLASLFLNVTSLEKPEFFARLAAGGDSATTGYLMPGDGMIDDHCNVLILQCPHVTNPATGQSVTLPDLPPLPVLDDNDFIEDGYLAFDPAESPHYLVFLIPMLQSKAASLEAFRQLEWPPSPFVLSVFSSRTGRWEVRSLVRQGEAAGTAAADMDELGGVHLSSVCWSGALYVPRQSVLMSWMLVNSTYTCRPLIRFVLFCIIPLSDSDHTYRMIKPPREVTPEDPRYLYIGRSEKGVYRAFIDHGMDHLWVWILDDTSCDQTEWVLTHHSAYGLTLPTYPQSGRPCWMIADVNKFSDSDEPLTLGKHQCEWDSDDDDDDGGTLNTQDMVQQRLSGRLLGFHPYREIIFFTRSSCRGCWAYHLKSSKLECLGKLLCPAYCYAYKYSIVEVENAFPYTPCWMGDLKEFQ
ncbi:hypothetical protein U9M48_034223 [Paspalum notatum var. saurae]|uniref:Uncharacterized protein n=1 Tax=Paspalum notatum var. saurae TaxID=547442 RepID=A0AAQ3X8P6_PASNO